jgi:uncharacterized protein (DUF427 family)
VQRRPALRRLERVVHIGWVVICRAGATGMETAMKAVWKGMVVAESNDTVVVEGNHYFPADSIKPEFLLPSNTRTMCSWKGQASYHTLFINGDANPDAVWYYPEPLPAAANIKGRVAFWKGVQVIE